MDCCKSSQCRGIEEVFDDRMARSELEDYRRDGSSRETLLLLESLLSEEVQGASLLDIGGGVGAIQHDLAARGAARVVNVDASPAYSKVAQEEAAGQGYSDRAEYHIGDFVDIAPDLEQADIVTLDRVICCYDDMPGLVAAAAGKALHVLAVIYPVDRWFIRLGVAAFDLFQAVFRNPFRIFVHPTAEVDALIRGSGFGRRFWKRGWFWQVVVYTR